MSIAWYMFRGAWNISLWSRVKLVCAFSPDSHENASRNVQVCLSTSLVSSHATASSYYSRHSGQCLAPVFLPLHVPNGTLPRRSGEGHSLAFQQALGRLSAVRSLKSRGWRLAFPLVLMMVRCSSVAPLLPLPQLALRSLPPQVALLLLPIQLLSFPSIGQLAWLPIRLQHVPRAWNLVQFGEAPRHLGIPPDLLSRVVFIRLRNVDGRTLRCQRA